MRYYSSEESFDYAFIEDDFRFWMNYDRLYLGISRRRHKAQLHREFSLSDCDGGAAKCWIYRDAVQFCRA